MGYWKYKKVKAYKLKENDYFKFSVSEIEPLKKVCEGFENGRFIVMKVIKKDHMAPYVITVNEEVDLFRYRYIK
jgi:hypothetical protein